MQPSTGRQIALPHQAGPVRVVQISDCHLAAEAGGRLLGMDTDHSLLAVLDTVAEGPEPDLLLATGDLADGGAAAAYQRLLDYLQPLGLPHFWLPGNHDNRAAMEALPDADSLLCDEIRVGCWQIVMLDSQVPGEIGGELGSSQLESLALVLETASRQGLYSLVCLHHQPVPIGCAWLDEQKVSDAEALFALLAQYPGVKGLLWGHVHQSFDDCRGSLRLMASPSTCVQFAPDSEDFRADERPPGYRWLELHADGKIESSVRRVEGVHFDIDLNQRGYL